MKRNINWIKTIERVKTTKTLLILLFGLTSIFSLTPTDSAAVETFIGDITVAISDKVKVTAHGAVGLDATFSVAKLVTEKPMVEKQEGTYVGEFEVVAGKHPDGTYDVAVNFNGAVKIQENALVIDKTAPTLWDVNADWTVSNGDILPLAVNAGEFGLDITVDVSALDSTQSHPISLLPGENGVYSAEIKISENNIATNGLKEILITAKDTAGNTSRLTVNGLLNNHRYVTELLPNYPNPFNPETWIPYRLAEDADVTLTIYDTRGQVVRTFVLGHQSAGAYETRDKAIYWNGRNNSGEPVASGIYFYNLSTGDYSNTRKASILK